MSADPRPGDAVVPADVAAQGVQAGGVFHGLDHARIEIQGNLVENPGFETDVQAVPSKPITAVLLKNSG